ncbi:hypothetical protein CBOM_00625 [Ceraceosorus bombacis]|uniref:Uncharacterized protein n=1 Tax=Ceraceosorus bombacis TaxID=401625 RepID=A0A0P1BBT8_9BASI|nr:hypothetical protein CBOM_00625 [Ceraceosorus bombacis]
MPRLSPRASSRADEAAGPSGSQPSAENLSRPRRRRGRPSGRAPSIASQPPPADPIPVEALQVGYADPIWEILHVHVPDDHRPRTQQALSRAVSAVVRQRFPHSTRFHVRSVQPDRMGWYYGGHVSGIVSGQTIAGTPYAQEVWLNIPDLSHMPSWPFIDRSLRRAAP